MVKKCSVCGVPLEGFRYKIASKIFGIRPSKKNLKVCNKCGGKKKK